MRNKEIMHFSQDRKPQSVMRRKKRPDPHCKSDLFSLYLISDFYLLLSVTALHGSMGDPDVSAAGSRPCAGVRQKSEPQASQHKAAS